MSLARKQFSTDVGGKTLTLEISSLAEKANAAVLGKYGETVVLTTVVMSEKESTADYLPLKVDYEEKFYAAGKIIGSRFIRREGRPSEEAILTGRVVDRVIRPLFNDRLRREIQVVVTVLSYDEENDPDFVGLLSASAALGISNVPWGGPASGVRVAKIGNEIVVNPNNSALQDQRFVFESFVAGPTGAINMIELSGREAKEEDILAGFTLAQKEIKKLIAFQERIIREMGRPKIEWQPPEIDPNLRAMVLKILDDRLEEVIYGGDKKEPGRRLHALREELRLRTHEAFGEAGVKHVDMLIEEAVDRLVRENILRKERRPDGRGIRDIRELNAEVGLFERTHGSALFLRGNTQALAVVTLAAPGAEQLIETMEVTTKRRFMFHYNFPPYSVGEIGTFRGAGRREIGHGALAEKAVRFLIPSVDEFPYTIRVVSEILSSNGSSSMASVCAASLALSDAGVPVKKMAAGIAMGLMVDQRPTSNNQPPPYKILTDIQGPEDRHGDMDFKIAGTEGGVTAIQMDVKMKGLTVPMIEKVLGEGRTARLTILKFMATVLPSARPTLSRYAPSIVVVKINPERIGAVIGSGGKTINGLIKKTGVASIDIEEDGRVYIAAKNPDAANAAAEEIKALTREFKVGDIIEGRIVKILDFGAIVDLGGGHDGMIHISELRQGFVKTVTDVVTMGDFVKAKVIRADQDGHIGLSLKQLSHV